MKIILKEYGGTLLLYVVIFFGIVAIGNTMRTLNEQNQNLDMIAINEAG